MAASSRFEWDTELLARAETLEWRSRVLVSGFLQGLHRSLLRGFSSEFAQYHPYSAGDDLRHLDWKAYARLDRLYIREFESETNLRCQMIVDASGSMGYQSQGTPFQKYEYSCLVAASLMRLLQKQRDAYGLGIATTQLEQYLPPRLGEAHFLRCLGVLESTKPTGPSDLGACVEVVAEQFSRKGLVLIFTDGWEDPARLVKAMQRLRFSRHEVCLFQIVDPREMDFEFSDSALFEDMETGIRLPVTPGWSKKRYLAALNRHQAGLERHCLDLGITHHMLVTDRRPFEAMASFLARREKRP